MNGTNSRESLAPAYNYYSKESFPYCDSHTGTHSLWKGPTRDIDSTNNPSFIIHEKKSRSSFLFLPNHRPTATGVHQNPRVKQYSIFTHAVTKTNQWIFPIKLTNLFQISENEPQYSLFIGVSQGFHLFPPSSRLRTAPEFQSPSFYPRRKTQRTPPYPNPWCIDVKVFI